MTYRIAGRPAPQSRAGLRRAFEGAVLALSIGFAGAMVLGFVG